MTARFDHEAVQKGVDATFEYGGLLLRAAGYTLLYGMADQYDCGKPLLAGVLVGDLGSNALLACLQHHRGLATVVSELALTAVVAFFVRDQLAWPTDVAMRAIFGLAAFAAVIGKFPHWVGTAYR